MFSIDALVNFQHMKTDESMLKKGFYTLFFTIASLHPSVEASDILAPERDVTHQAYQTELFQQCILDSCGPNRSDEDLLTKWENMPLPSHIQALADADVEEVFSLLESTSGLFSQNKTIAQTNLTQQELAYLLFCVVVGAIPEDSHSEDGLFVYDEAKYAKRFSEFPQVAQALSLLFSFPIAQELLLFSITLQNDAYAFTDWSFHYAGRDAGILAMRQLAKDVNSKLANLESNVRNIIDAATHPAFYRVLQEPQYNPEDLSLFIRFLLLRKVFVAIFTESQDFLNAAQEFDAASFFEKKLSPETKKSIEDYTLLSDRTKEGLKHQLRKAYHDKLSLYYHSRPNASELNNFLKVTQHARNDVINEVKKLFSAKFSTSLTPLIEGLEFRTIMGQGRFEKQKEEGSTRLKQKIEFLKQWKDNRFSYFVLLEHLASNAEILESFADLLDDPEFQMSRHPVEFSTKYGPTILTGWHGPMLKSSFSTILRHEIAHKIEFFWQQHPKMLTTNDKEKIKTMTQCFHKLHPVASAPAHANSSESIAREDKYFSEDFADAIAANSSPKGENLACLFIPHSPDLSFASVTQSNLEDTHSSDFFRLLHVSSIRGQIPNSCKVYVAAYENNLALKNCLYEAAHSSEHDEL